ncbi:hypothetical protein BDR05DRAFT_966904 [Suillus weaverae]|nr:hypothetical protein BDR05DRAFT_966904 [Suillus weaverae]
MDLITSGVTILTLVQTIAQTSALLLGYVASARKADSSCQSLLNELSSISGVLTTVMEIEKDRSLPDNLRLALSKLMVEDGPVLKLQKELENILPNEQEKRKMIRWTWPFKEKKAGAILDSLKGYCVEITNILVIDTWITLTEVDRGIKKVDLGVQDVGRRVQEVGQGVQQLKVAQEVQKKAEEREKFLQWMNPVPCSEKHSTSRCQRNAATGRWIFHAEQYVTWNISDSAFLWLNGQPGSGKTILASAVIDEIQGGGQAELQTLGYFYCNFRDDQTIVAATVLRSLVVQLLRQSEDDWIPKIREPEQEDSNAEEEFVSLHELGQQQRNGERCPTDLRFLRQLLVEASMLVHRPVLVIDALDECKDHSDLVEHLVALAGDARLRLFVTGRSEPDIQDAFCDLPTMSLKDSAEQMKADMCVHITEQLKTQKRLSRLPDTLRTSILEKLLEKANGMFRWVQCQLDEIRRCARDIDIKDALNNLPTGLDETYDRIICSIQQKGRGYDQIAQHCLLWLAGALTPLTLDQLNEAMMIDVKQSSLNPDLRASDPMDIVVACGSLVTYDEMTGVVALSHYSVKEYLISRHPNNILESISDMHARICELLITYVLCDSVPVVCAKATGCTAGFASVAGGDKKHPLLSYAFKALAHLCHVSDKDSRVIAALQRLHLEFVHNTEKHPLLESLVQPLTDGGQSNVISPSLLFVPLRFGNPWMVETLVKEQPDLLGVDVARGLGSPLIFAIASNTASLSVLLELGVDLNKPSSIQTDLYHQRDLPSGSYVPISWAAAIGSSVAVELLLSQPEVNLPDDIVHTAVVSKWRSPEIIYKLCQRGADVTFTVDGSTPIHTLLSKLGPRTDQFQWLPVVKAFVRDISAQDWTARTALRIALDRRLSDVVAYLLEQNARLTATATLHPTIWSWATKSKWFAKVQAAALAADQPYTRIMGKIIDATGKSRLVEFPGAVTNHGDHNPMCAVVVSVVDRKLYRWPAVMFPRIVSLEADLSRGKLLLQNNAQNSPENEELARLNFRLTWVKTRQRVSSRLLDYHQGDTVTSTLRQLTRDKDSTSDSLFLRLSRTKEGGRSTFDDLEYALDIYRGHLH